MIFCVIVILMQPQAKIIVLLILSDFNFQLVHHWLVVIGAKCHTTLPHDTREICKRSVAVTAIYKI